MLTTFKDMLLVSFSLHHSATSFDDAMKLGDNSARTALSLSLALTGEGKYREAAALLNDWEGEIATADLGLALALAAQPERGIHLMSNAIRQGDNTPKMRQNLAYAYALAGRWREARIMAAQDVPADQVSERIAKRLDAPDARIDDTTRAHLEECRFRINKLLDAGIQTSEP